MVRKNHSKVASELAENKSFDCENISSSAVGIEVTPDIGQYEVNKLRDEGYTLCYTSTTGKTGKYDRVLVFKKYSDA